MTISRPVAGDDARPPRIIGHDSFVLPWCSSWIMVMFVLIAWVREIIKPLAACPTPGPVFTLPMARLPAHPISEDIVPTRFI